MLSQHYSKVFSENCAVFYLISFQSIRLWSMSDFISRLVLPRQWTSLKCTKRRSRAIADHLGVQLHCNKTISLKKKINRQQKNVYFYILYSLLRSQNKMATSWSLSLGYQSLSQAFIVLCLYKIHLQPNQRFSSLLNLWKLCCVFARFS